MRVRHENCTNPASWEEVRITPASFNIRNAPFARGYFLGDYMGLDNAGNAFLAMFGQAFTPNDANQYVQPPHTVDGRHARRQLNIRSASRRISNGDRHCAAHAGQTT